MKKSIESFIIGMGSIMNIAGNYHDVPRYKRKNRNKYITKYRDKYKNKKVMSNEEAFEYDMKALQSDWETLGKDWEVIGNDLRKVMNENPVNSFDK